MSKMCLRNVYQTMVFIWLCPNILGFFFLILPHFNGFFDVLFWPAAELLVAVHLHHFKKWYINEI